MRRVDDAADMDSCFHNAQREAKAAFGSDDLYMEKFLLNPKHVEVQILADHDGQAIHLGERDCSMQRRHQKLIEETPCARLDQATREKMCQMALRACAAANYECVGTIEFLLDEDGSFYFMEMNTRISGASVTEMATGIDWCNSKSWSPGQRLSHRRGQVAFNGHVTEVASTPKTRRATLRPALAWSRFILLRAGRESELTATCIPATRFRRITTACWAS